MHENLRVVGGDFGKSACGLCTLAFSCYGSCFCLRKFAFLYPAEWANLRKYALETYQGADCEIMRAAKIKSYDISVMCESTRCATWGLRHKRRV